MESFENEIYRSNREYNLKSDIMPTNALTQMWQKKEETFIEDRLYNNPVYKPSDDDVLEGGGPVFSRHGSLTLPCDLLEQFFIIYRKITYMIHPPMSRNEFFKTVDTFIKIHYSVNFSREDFNRMINNLKNDGDMTHGPMILAEWDYDKMIETKISVSKKKGKQINEKVTEDYIKKMFENCGFNLDNV
jgi:hypothetical protein